MSEFRFSRDGRGYPHDPKGYLVTRVGEVRPFASVIRTSGTSGYWGSWKGRLLVRPFCTVISDSRRSVAELLSDRIEP